MTRLSLTPTLVTLFFVVISASASQGPLSSLSDIFVYPIWGMGGEPFADVRVELLDTEGKAVATGVSSTELPVVMLKGLSRGTYTLRLSHQDPKREMNPVARTVQLFRPEHWFTESLGMDLQGFVYRSPEEQAVAKDLGTFEGRVLAMPKEGGQPLWARMMGIFSNVILDSRVKTDGTFDFRIQPGFYVLVVMRGTRLCSIQQVHSFRKIDEGPLRVTLGPSCR